MRRTDRVPAGKRIVLIGMGYDRNGAWTTAEGGPEAAPVNVASLRDLQIPTYLGGHDDPRVIALVCFSYGRPGGTRGGPNPCGRSGGSGQEAVIPARIPNR